MCSPCLHRNCLPSGRHTGLPLHLFYNCPSFQRGTSRLRRREFNNRGWSSNNNIAANSILLSLTVCNPSVLRTPPLKQGRNMLCACRSAMLLSLCLSGGSAKQKHCLRRRNIYVPKGVPTITLVISEGVLKSAQLSQVLTALRALETWLHSL